MGGGAALSRAVEPDYARVHIELRRKGLTLKLLWAEYRPAHEGQRTWAYWTAGPSRGLRLQLHRLECYGRGIDRFPSHRPAHELVKPFLRNLGQLADLAAIAAFFIFVLQIGIA